MSRERKASRLVLCVVAGFIVGAAASAQPYTSGYVPGGGYGYARPYYGGWGYGGYGYSPGIGSTAYGSYLGGMSQVIRAQGQYNLMSSQAAINAEQAAKQDIENRQAWTNAYFEMRKINQAYTDSQRSPRLPTEEWVRIAHDAAPQRLSPSALDPVSGRIAWPTALQGPEFQADRDTLERLFGQRAVTHGAIGVDQHAQIRTTIDVMLNKLKSRIREIDSKRYLEARSFLGSLGREADFPSG